MSQQPQMTEGQAMQPAASPQMTTAPPKKEESFLRSTSEAYVKSAAKEAGEETTKYEAANGQQQFDAAKAEAQGLWAKYCGCFSSLSG